ncbi:hypothetical protein FEM03_13200 [Phragmitibacter flavus]|uniref:Uncharacterized protein n=1 Tax=Phragmitibacter flavus TaxID=2576071 RepID=A0A5R8KDY1_9BACT|nr:urease accessory UreF family protein [Phragmitibacter flavus]TLD70145.1 hypothetical protein FEM03_13200 [Phragmitibacter flavus]
MIKRFPTRLQTAAHSSAEEVSSLHVASQFEEGDEGLAWVHWMFQSARLRHGALTFTSQGSGRPAVLVDWEKYVRTLWLPLLAPAMLRGWQAALDNDDAGLHTLAVELNQTLDPETARHSIGAGSWLLTSTQGAKYQGPLGRLRNKVDLGETEPHLPVVWAAIAALFQLPAPDLLMAVLREEWRAGCPEGLPHAEPQGPLSFGALTATALHASFQARTVA